VEHADHVRLIGDGVRGAGPRWLDLGAGRGAFTLAVADVLGANGQIVAVDRDRSALADLATAMRRVFPDLALSTLAADFTAPLDLEPGSFDGIVAANSLHFDPQPAPILRSAARLLRPAGRLVVVEYDADTGTPYVPYPISFRALPALLRDGGFGEPRLIGRVPSRYLGAIYSAVSESTAGRQHLSTVLPHPSPAHS
jgi:ubiquinone/menaquinone biosynthesis C-methylase UbiE